MENGERSERASEQPRKIGIAEGYKIAQLLEIDFSSLIWKIEQRMKAEEEKE